MAWSLGDYGWMHWNPVWTKTWSRTLWEQLSWKVQAPPHQLEGPPGVQAELHGCSEWIGFEISHSSRHILEGLLSAHSIICLFSPTLCSHGVEPSLTTTLIIKCLWVSETEAVITNNYLLSTILLFAVAFNHELWFQNWLPAGFSTLPGPAPAAPWTTLL